MGLLSLLFGSSRRKSQFDKYLIVPDIHGTYSVYKKIHKYIQDNLTKDRQVVFLGDYMDRGEEGKIDGREFADAGSYFTIRDIISLKKWAEKKDFSMVFLRGNHEIFFENFFIDGSINAYKQYPFFQNSVNALEYVMQKDHKFTEDFIDFLKSLKPYFLDEKNGYLFVHAGIDPDIRDLHTQIRKGSVYWIRDKFILSKKRLPYTVIFGHTPFFEPFIKKDKIGLDCGVYRTGYINLLEINGSSYHIIKI